MRKLTVEDCHKLSIYELKTWLQPGQAGSMTWSRLGRKDSVSFQVVSYPEIDSIQPAAVRLGYTVTSYGGQAQALDYQVDLLTTPLPWGGVRYWFACPCCGRRVACLYLPPNDRIFKCRHCHNLTYTSCQEQHKFDGMFARLAAGMQSDLPGITAKAIRAALEGDTRQSYIPAHYWEAHLAQLAEAEARLARYLTAEQLCEQSGLPPSDLAALESARLLLPDRDGKYRPKLAGWARKLAYLLGEGWDIPEIAAWAHGRWGTPDPRTFPPDRAAWRSGPTPTRLK